MKLHTRTARGGVVAVALAVGLSGAALAAVAAPASAQPAADVVAKQAAKPKKKGKKKLKATVRHATASAYVDSETNKLEVSVYGDVKVKIKVPKTHKGGWLSGELVGKVGGKKAKGYIYPYWNSKKEKYVLKKPASFSLNTGKRKAARKPVELKKITWTFYSADYTVPPVEKTQKLNSNRIRVKPAAYAGVYHFPKKKTLRIRGYQAVFSKKKLKKLRKKSEKSANKGKNRYAKGYPVVRGLPLVVQKAKNKKATKWKTIGRVRLNGKGMAAFSRKVKKGGQYRVKFAGNAQFNKFESWSSPWSGKPSKAGWPKPKAKYLGGMQGGGRVADGFDLQEDFEQNRAGFETFRRAQS